MLFTMLPAIFIALAALGAQPLDDGAAPEMRKLPPAPRQMEAAASTLPVVQAAVTPESWPAAPPES